MLPRGDKALSPLGSAFSLGKLATMYKSNSEFYLNLSLLSVDFLSFITMALLKISFRFPLAAIQVVSCSRCLRTSNFPHLYFIIGNLSRY